MRTNFIATGSTVLPGTQRIVLQTPAVATGFAPIVEGRYEARIARTKEEIRSAFKLRYEVFCSELGGRSGASGSRLEYDEYDLKCRHLIVIDRAAGKIVGTYRLNTIETAGSPAGFYSYSEFSIEDIPAEVLCRGIEIGRACIAKEHRNSRVLWLLWKGLYSYLSHSQKRYFFGCCSVFSGDETIGRDLFVQLTKSGSIHRTIQVTPRANAVDLEGPISGRSIELPALFNMYLRLGAAVCGPPILDREFGTIDFFVIFDALAISEKYRRMFSA